MRFREIIIVYKDTLAIKRGQEWHLSAFPADVGAIVRIEVESDERVYLGFYSDEYYNIIKRKNNGSFPFSVGDDDVYFNNAYAIDKSTNYRVVVRLSLFNKEAETKLTVELNSPPKE